MVVALVLIVGLGCSESERSASVDGGASASTSAGAGVSATAGAGVSATAGAGGALGSAGLPNEGGAAGAGGVPGTSGAAGIGGGAGSASGGAGGEPQCPGAKYDPAALPTTLTLAGDLGVHDPAAYVMDSNIYLAGTGLIAKASSNLTSWSAAPNPLPLPSWTVSATGASNLWAPDVSYFGGSYHLYYSASTFGSKKSCIGQATRTTLDGGDWTDQGMVVCSNVAETDDWNAIDPNVVLDDSAAPWLVFGSFWSGIKAVRLDSTGKRADTDLYALAHHAGGEEGAWIFKRCGYYYLFFSSGACCDGAFDYNIQVGRARSVTGPYVDKAGVDLMSGGGTPLVRGDASWVAPGHNAVIAYGGKTYNIYHALRGSSKGPATLRIAEIVWDENEWPISGGP